MRCHKQQLTGYVANHLRGEDREEMCAARGIKNTRPAIRAALQQSVAMSAHCHFFRVNNTPLAVLGLVPQPDGRAVIWMLACDGIEQCVGEWMRWFMTHWEAYKTRYTQLYNAAYAKNASHLTLIRRLNCHLGEVNDKGFIPFWSV